MSEVLEDYKRFEKAINDEEFDVVIWNSSSLDPDLSLDEIINIEQNIDLARNKIVHERMTDL
jgi:hypothetical protein